MHMLVCQYDRTAVDECTDFPNANQSNQLWSLAFTIHAKQTKDVAEMSNRKKHDS